MLVALTFAPLCDQVADQPWPTCWLPGKVNRSVQPLTVAEPVLVMVMFAVKPVLQSLVL